MSASATSPTPSRGLLVAAFAIVYVVWGSTYFGIRYAVESIPPFLMGGSRFLVAGMLLFAWAQRHGWILPSRQQWRDATICGTLMLLGGNGGVTWAEKTIPSSVAALIVAIVPLWMVLLEWSEPSGQRPSLRIATGLVIGFAGVAMLVSHGKGYEGASLNPWGVAAIVIATIAWASGSVFSRHADKPSSAFASTGIQMITGGGVMLMVGFSLGEGSEFRWSNVTSISAWAWLYLTLFGSLIAFTAYVWLLQVSTPSRVSTTSFVNPLIAVILGCALGGEPFTSTILVSTAMILIAVVLILRRRVPRANQPESQPKPPARHQPCHAETE